MNYIFFKTKDGEDRVIRIRYPVFVGKIKEAYEQDCDDPSQVHKGFRVCIIDNLREECPPSKLKWACKKAIDWYLHLNNQNENPVPVDYLAFNYIKKNRRYLNISAIEEAAGITRTSLMTAINRDQKRFGNSNLLTDFLNQEFEGWNS